jgi:hypothetical protein
MRLDDETKICKSFIDCVYAIGCAVLPAPESDEVTGRY